MNIRTIPAHLPFLSVLARGIMTQSDQTNTPLYDFTILLPTRRACRALQDEFLNLCDGKPVLLPRISPIGDIDEQELILQSPIDTELTPAMPDLQRALLLMRLIEKWYETAKSISLSRSQSWQLASALTELIDQVHIEQLIFSDITKLVSSEYALHWQDVVDFLSILQQQWQSVIAATGMIEGAARTNQLLQAQARHWRNHPPQTPIIAAGSTASIPATAELLQAIAQLPNGCVILPGLDQNLDDAPCSLDETSAIFY